ncbi:helix-turn-helix domain-containing protein [Haloferax namakaokahaiae]|uniref:Helix-turn-helix domain-containing protein n=1 Tax=Haloferax namakaokahaiae TaxID=1748331 RepID=A0ABD5ZDS2_9EURY
MTLYVGICIDSPVLKQSIDRSPDVTLSVEQQTTSADGVLDITLRCLGGELDAFEAHLDTDETVSRWVPIDGVGPRRLYRVRLTERASSTFEFDRWVDGKGVFLSAEREVCGWVLQAYLPDRCTLRQFAEGCESNDVQFDITQLMEIGHVNDMRQLGLSSVQAETLRTALECGYYSIPRETNLEELAKSLDVSHQAVSERLRRAVRSLLEHTIADQGERFHYGRPRLDATESPTTVHRQVDQLPVEEPV